MLLVVQKWLAPIILMFMMMFILYLLIRDKDLKGFWNDNDGVTVTDILCFIFGAVTCYLAILSKMKSDVFAEIVIWCILASAGVTGVKGYFNKKSLNVGFNNEGAKPPDGS